MMERKMENEEIEKMKARIDLLETDVSDLNNRILLIEEMIARLGERKDNPQ